MKWLTWILLGVNVAMAAFFVALSHWPQTPSTGHAPLHVDRLSLRSQAPAGPEPTKSPAAHATEALCVEWRGLTADEVVAARSQLKVLVAERVMSFTEMPLETRHWVIFPPLPSAQSAAAKLSELKAAAVNDAFVVNDAAWRHAISLGLYATAEMAARRVRELEDKGVLGTRVEVLPRQGTDFYFVIRSEDPDALKSLGEIRQAYPNSRQSRVACPS
jgi:hypothetical protein